MGYLQPQIIIGKVMWVNSTNPGLVGEQHNSGVLFREKNLQLHIVFQGAAEVFLIEAEAVADELKIEINQ